MPKVIVHINNEDPVIGEMDELPGEAAVVITVKNPVKRDGKDLHYIEPNVTTVIWPMYRINFIEVLSTDAEDEIISFVRE
ncbi:MAG: hypothetical protein JEZ00_17880 [Anaerolineaceae bacterium]|nr:hypothetical protein [Anaerolineaceae bacterium]